MTAICARFFTELCISAAVTLGAQSTSGAQPMGAARSAALAASRQHLQAVAAK
jgi:hypothetical protein